MPHSYWHRGKLIRDSMPHMQSQCLTQKGAVPVVGSTQLRHSALRSSSATRRGILYSRISSDHI